MNTVVANSLAEKYPDIASEWNYARNGDLTPEMVSAGSHKKVWWIGKCGHEWDMIVKSRTGQKQGCPFCSNHRVLSGFNDLATKHPELLEQWDYKRNEIQPSEILPASREKVWWRCRQCGGSYLMSVGNKSVGNHGCPYCSGHQVLIGYNDLATTHSEIAAEWNYARNGDLTPEMVSAGSHKKVWWIGECGHEWEAVIKERTSKKRGCPACFGRKIVDGVNNLTATHPYIAMEWDYERNSILPTEVTHGSKIQIWWKCSRCGFSWKSTPKYRTTARKGCPHCAKQFKTSFPEQALFYYIKQYYPDAINSYKYKSRKTIDIFIPSLSIGIEYDGVNWHSNTERDEIKNQELKNLGIRLIRIREREHRKSGIKQLPSIKNTWCTIEYDIDGNEYLDADKSLNEIIRNTLLTISILCAQSPSEQLVINIAEDEEHIMKQLRLHMDKRSLAVQSPDIAAEWNYEKNGDLLPSGFANGSNQKVWWKCSVCQHEWQAAIGNRTGQGQGCPECGKKKTNINNRRAVICIEMSKKYDSIAQASKKTGISRANIISCCKGKTKTAGGYHWRYTES